MGRNSTKSYRRDEGVHQRSLQEQPTPFVGLILSPFVGLAISYLVHMFVAGVTIGGRQILTGNDFALGVTVMVIALAAVGIAAAAWHFSHGRHKPVRYVLTGSVAVVVLWLAVLVAVGPERWSGFFFVLIAWTVAGVWFMPRLHVLRRNPNEDTPDTGDDLMKELGLTGFKHKGKPTVTYDDKGNPVRVVATIKHKYGTTRDKLQAAIRNLESAAGGAPEGLSRVTPPDNGRSDESVVTMVLQDPLKARVPYPGLSHPGGSVADYATVGLYDDGEPVRAWACGGTSPEGVKMPPTGYAFMGMTRAGKTVTENRLLIDGFITRRNAVILYLNQAKGVQDVQPIISGVEVCILSDGSSAYLSAFNKVKQIGAYRQRKLGEYGISAWTAEKCFDNPPTHTLDGRAIPMEPMPALVVHVGEADAILESTGELAIWLASKGLSLGIIAGWSMQRWAATSMPTDLRFNIGTSFCFGVGDDYSASFALSESTLKAGANPHNWKNRYPGKFYVENIGIPENRFPVPARGVGDDDDDTLYRRMREICEEYGPRMALLDRGSADATGGWWDQQRNATNELRRSMRPGAPPAYAAPAQADTRQEEPMARNHPGDPVFTAGDPDPNAPTPEEMQARHEVEVEVATTDEINGEKIAGEYLVTDPDDPGQYDELAGIDPDRPVPPPPDADDGIDLTGGKPEPSSREEAEAALDKALREMAADTTLIEPGDENHIVFRVSQLQRRYPFRVRSWFSPRLASMADGERECPPGYRLEKLPDRRGEGWYRMNRFPGQY
jgi:hypothetical protein